MKLSVVISTMDRASFLDRNIASMSEGRVKPDEIVIVDSSSSGETREMAGRWAREWPAVRYLAGGKIGTSEARNLAVEAASGDLILITDDDCLTHPRCVERVIELFRADPDMDCLCGSVLPYGDVKGKVAVATKTTQERQEWRGKNRPWGIGHSIDMAFRRESYIRVGGFDEEMGPGTPLFAAEDLDLIYRVLAAGGKVVYDPSVIIYHDQWRSPSQARRRRVDYARGTAAFLLKHMLVLRDPFALLMTAIRLWEDVPLLALIGLWKRNLECELVSLYQLWGLTVGFWVAARFYGRRLLTGGMPRVEMRALR